MEERSSNRLLHGGYYTVWECVIPYITDPLDLQSVSLVSRAWYSIDRITRRHVTMALCYTSTPRHLSTRFPYLESVKLKGKPRAAMFNLIPEDWGGYATPWVEEITRAFSQLKAVHFRRMIVGDKDLEVLATVRGRVLEVLNLDKCSGFSTHGLLCITRSCRSVTKKILKCLEKLRKWDTLLYRGSKWVVLNSNPLAAVFATQLTLDVRNLKSLLMEESIIEEHDDEWLHELAISNRVLENLNFYMTDLKEVKFEDLELIARNCPSLLSMKINDCDLLHLKGFFQAAASLEEFAGGSFSEPEQVGENVSNFQLERYSPLTFPSKLCRLGFTYLGNIEMPIVFPIASRLTRLDLLYALLDTEGHCQLLERCPNLEILETRNVVGDRGLEVLARFCKKMKRLRIERGADEQEMEDVEGVVSQRGLTALAQGCTQLEYIAVYVSDITNASLECIGNHMKNLRDFRLVLLDREERITDLPLDNGVRSLLRGCNRLRRFALYLRPGGLTDVGLSYVGKYSLNIRWMLLGYVGESDKGILEFSKGCPSLQKLEIRGCCFSDRALAQSALRLSSLRYLWVQGYRASSYNSTQEILAMARPFWNIELIPARRLVADEPNEHPAHILAYYSLAGPRTDFPSSVISLHP